MWFSIFLLVLLAIFIFLLWSNKAVRLPGLPGPKWVPILGNTLEIMKHVDNIHPWLYKQALIFKRPYRVSMFNTVPFIHFAGNPSHIQHILKDNFRNYILPKRRVEILKELLGDGIFASNGDTWRMHRKAASHIFTLRNLRDYMPKVLEAHGNVFVDLLNKKCESGEDVEIQSLFFRYTMDSFTEIAFGESTNCLTKEDHPFSTSFDRAQRLLVARYFDPIWVLKKKLGIGREKEVLKDIAILDEYASKVIAKRRRDECEGIVKHDLISQFLNVARANQTQLQDKELRDIIINFLVAGRDTTACALTWLTYELIRHPHIEEKVLEEIQKVFGRDWEEQKEGKVDAHEEADYYYRRVGELEYTEIVILETLRLHPPVGADDREAVQDDVLPDGTPVPKGTNIFFNPWQNNRSLQVWGETATQFNPDRWLDESGKRKEISPFMYPTFSAGPRICLGKSLALLEIKLLLSLLLPRFRFELADPSYEPLRILSVVIAMKPPGLPLKVTQRNIVKHPILSSKLEKINLQKENEAK